MKKVPTFLLVCLIFACFLGSSGCISSKNPGNNLTTIPQIFLPRTPFPTPTCDDHQNGPITMNRAGLHYVGEVFEINGTTDLLPEEKLNISIFPPVYAASGKSRSLSGAWWQMNGHAVIKPVPSGKNAWSFMLNTTGFSESLLNVLVFSENSTIGMNSQIYLCENSSRKKICEEICNESCGCLLKT